MTWFPRHAEIHGVQCVGTKKHVIGIFLLICLAACSSLGPQGAARFVLEAIEGNGVSISIRSGDRVAIVENAESRFQVIYGEGIGENVWFNDTGQFFVGIENRTGQDIKFRESMLSFYVSEDGISWESWPLVPALKTNRRWQNLLARAHKTETTPLHFLYDNDIRPGETYGGSVDFDGMSAKFNFARLTIGEPSPAAVVFLFKKIPKE